MLFRVDTSFPHLTASRLLPFLLCHTPPTPPHLTVPTPPTTSFRLPIQDGKQELEIYLDGQHVSFALGKLGSLLAVEESKDPEGLRVLYYLVQDLRCFVLSLIALHFKIKPHPNV